VGVVKEVLEAGAHGFIEKSATLEDFREALLAVAEGRTYLGPATQKLMAADNGAASALVKSISPREREVLKLIVEGMSTKQIANALKISFKTADNHRANLMKKLGVHDVVTLTRKAVKLGLALVE
jgi:DNA-binding NarL/FixJ family response regulator